VLTELRRRVASGELEPGAPIRQDRLARELGTSRHPIREALRVLEGERLVVHRPHRGYYVASLDADTLREIYRLRDLLESEAIRVAIPKVTDALVDELEATAARLEHLDASQDLATFIDTNRHFHFLLFEAAGMPQLDHHLRLLWESSESYRTRYYLHASNVTRVHADHAAIVEAVRTRDAPAAIEALRRHRDTAVARLVAQLGKDAT
jgi:DNA-binding GntR family transcriptional regulator